MIAGRRSADIWCGIEKDDFVRQQRRRFLRGIVLAVLLGVSRLANADDPLRSRALNEGTDERQIKIVRVA